tara:strand:+ start:2775 stop:3707 length:933 start_codon:yes stop_codon:yes gene_type:complete
MIKILHLDENHNVLKNGLDEMGFKNFFDYKSSKIEIEQKIAEFDGIVLRSRIKIDKNLLDRTKNLKFIARVGSGIENIDSDYAKKKGIVVLSAGEGNANAVGEHALSMLLSLFNNIIKSNNEINTNIWKREENRGIELNYKTVGIIGYGKTGKSFAKKLAGFNVKLLCSDIIENIADDYAEQVSIDEIQSRCDIISLHTDLNKLSKHLVNTKFIDNCKKPFYLINTSRGQCVKTSDLILGIKTGKILGACLDVIENESNSFENFKQDSYLDFLKKSEKVILTPHIAGWTFESKLKLSQIILKKIKDLYSK